MPNDYPSNSYPSASSFQPYFTTWEEVKHGFNALLSHFMGMPNMFSTAPYEYKGAGGFRAFEIATSYSNKELAAVSQQAAGMDATAMADRATSILVRSLKTIFGEDTVKDEDVAMISKVMQTAGANLSIAMPIIANVFNLKPEQTKTLMSLLYGEEGSRMAYVTSGGKALSGMMGSHDVAMLMQTTMDTNLGAGVFNRNEHFGLSVGDVGEVQEEMRKYGVLNKRGFDFSNGGFRTMMRQKAAAAGNTPLVDQRTIAGIANRQLENQKEAAMAAGRAIISNRTKNFVKRDAALNTDEPVDYTNIATEIESAYGDMVKQLTSGGEGFAGINQNLAEATAKYMQINVAQSYIKDITGVDIGISASKTLEQNLKALETSKDKIQSSISKLDDNSKAAINGMFIGIQDNVNRFYSGNAGNTLADIYKSGDQSRLKSIEDDLSHKYEDYKTYLTTGNEEALGNNRPGDIEAELKPIMGSKNLMEQTSVWEEAIALIRQGYATASGGGEDISIQQASQILNNIVGDPNQVTGEDITKMATNEVRALLESGRSGKEQLAASARVRSITNSFGFENAAKENIIAQQISNYAAIEANNAGVGVKNRENIASIAAYNANKAMQDPKLRAVGAIRKFMGMLDGREEAANLTPEEQATMERLRSGNFTEKDLQQANAIARKLGAQAGYTNADITNIIFGNDAGKQLTDKDVMRASRAYTAKAYFTQTALQSGQSLGLKTEDAFTYATIAASHAQEFEEIQKDLESGDETKYNNAVERARALNETIQDEMRNNGMSEDAINRLKFNTDEEVAQYASQTAARQSAEAQRDGLDIQSYQEVARQGLPGVMEAESNKTEFMKKMAEDLGVGHNADLVSAVSGLTERDTSLVAASLRLLGVQSLKELDADKYEQLSALITTVNAQKDPSTIDNKMINAAIATYGKDILDKVKAYTNNELTDEELNEEVVIGKDEEGKDIKVTKEKLLQNFGKQTLANDATLRSNIQNPLSDLTEQLAEEVQKSKKEDTKKNEEAQKQIEEDNKKKANDQDVAAPEKKEGDKKEESTEDKLATGLNQVATLLKDIAKLLQDGSAKVTIKDNKEQGVA